MFTQTNKAPGTPHLQMVPVDAVLPHEEHDAQRSAPLIERIREAQVWLNPPIVTPIENDGEQALETQRYALLDGANRHHCIQAMGFPHILVQVVDYESEHVELDTWNHVLSNVEMDHVLPEVYKIEGLHVEHSDPLTAQAALARRECIAYIRVLPDWVLMLIADKTDVRNRNASLRALVNTYKRIARLDRINHDSPRLITAAYPDAKAVVIFPQYAPAEIIVAARDKVYLPPGISRHVIHGRAMRLHYPLSELSDTDKSLEAKNEALQQWVQGQFAKRRVRYYQEAMYIFDD